MQAAIAGQAEQIVHLIVLTPGHQLLSGKAGVGPQQDLDLGPAGAQVGDDALDLVEGAGGGIDVGGSQQGAEQMAAREDVKGQIAVAPVVAMEEAVLLLPVEGIVGGVEVENDLIGGFRVGLGEQFDQEGLQGLGAVVDLMVAVGALGGGVFEPVEGALACRGMGFSNRLSPGIHPGFEWSRQAAAALGRRRKPMDRSSWERGRPARTRPGTMEEIPVKADWVRFAGERPWMAGCLQE